LTNTSRQAVVVTDATILINLCHVTRLDLLGSLGQFRFVIPDDVVSEVRMPDQAEQVAQAFASGLLERIAVDAPADLAVFGELRERFGAGESACLALATANGWCVASDEGRAYVREVGARLGPGHLLTTPGLLVLCIRAGHLTVAQADAIKDELARHRFKMKFSSFTEKL
jgi:predicted nucleic acid-binding protein